MAFNYSPKIVTDGLVMYLDAGNNRSYASGSTSWLDLSRGENNGTLTNGPTFSSANGGSIVFDGTNDYVDIATLANIHYTSSLTLESWVLLTGTGVGGGYRGIVGKGLTDTDEEYSLSVSTGANKIYMDVGGGSGPYIDATYVSSLNTTYHIVGTHQRVVGTSTLTIYVNGNFISNTTAGSTQALNSNSYNTVIGSRFSTGSQSWPGYIYNVKMYNRALSAQEVLQNYNALKGRFNL
jgi:hypothetical protein